MNSLQFDELSKEFEDDVREVAKVSSPDLLIRLANLFNTDEGILVNYSEKCKEMLLHMDASVSVDTLTALTKLAIFLQARAIDANVSALDLVRELRQYATLKGIPLPNELEEPLAKMIEPSENARRRRVAIGRLNFAFNAYGSVEYRNELRLVSEGYHDFAIPVTTIKIKYRNADGREQQADFILDDEDVYRLSEEIAKCKDNLNDLIKKHSNQFTIYRFWTRDRLNKDSST